LFCIVAYAQTNFASAKSISSAQYFGEQDATNPTYQAEKQQRLAKFSGAKSISSADYYDRDESGMRGRGGGDEDLVSRIAETAKQDLGSLKDSLYEGGKKFASLAKDWFSDVADRYG